jgi:hypothetical protein
MHSRLMGERFVIEKFLLPSAHPGGNFVFRKIAVTTAQIMCRLLIRLLREVVPAAKLIGLHFRDTYGKMFSRNFWTIRVV